MLCTAIGSVTSLMLIAAPAVSSAHPKPSPAPTTPEVIATGLAAPFNLDLTTGRVLFADGFANLVGKVRADGSVKVLAADQPGASGIARNGSRLAFTTTVSDANNVNTASGLNIWGPHGKRIVADTLGYETDVRNSDAGNTYGPDSSDPCVVQAVGPQYTGAIDSHAYSVTAFGKGWIVADAGANALLKVDRRGTISTLAVLPPQPLKVTQEIIDASQSSDVPLPDCMLGVTYSFEPVPTDVEVGRDGYLYVTTLPGGPETPAFGPRGKLWKVNPWTGRATVVAAGFSGATNLAIGRSGEVYVSELFGGGIAVVRHGKRTGFIPLPGAVAVETDRSGGLYAGTITDRTSGAPGTIVRISKGKVTWKAWIRH